MDQATGHMDAEQLRMINESGRMVVLTPAGTSGFVQPCDDVLNGAFQSGFYKVKK